tara:strand:- start:36343 stop:36744 length:402 start_codon:yes stop_codon:yes gene_type:complete
MPVDLTSTWIPLSLLAVLSLYMFMLFRKERRESLAVENAAAGQVHTLDAGHSDNVHASGHGDSHSDASAADSHAHAAPAADHGHNSHTAATEPKASKSRLLWRTAHIWLPIAAGFSWQAYIDFIRPMLDKAAG